MILIMKAVSVSEFKVKCFELLKNVSKSREPLMVMSCGEPIVRVEPSHRKVRSASVHLRVGWKLRTILLASDIETNFLCSENRLRVHRRSALPATGRMPLENGMGSAHGRTRTLPNPGERSRRNALLSAAVPAMLYVNHV